jgi:hypothetical protein
VNSSNNGNPGTTTAKGAEVSSESSRSTRPSDAPSEFYAADEVIDIQKLVRIFVKWGWLVALFALIGAGKGLQDAHNFTPLSIAKMTVKPVQSTSSKGNPGGVKAIFSGLSLGSDKATNKLEDVILFVGTQTFAKLMDEKYGLLLKVYGGGWDEQRQEWRRPAESRFRIEEKINSYLNQRQWSAPTLEDLSRFISGSFQAKQNENSTHYSVKVENSDPEFALWLLTTVFHEGIEYLRREEETTLAIQRKFVLDKLEHTRVVDFQRQLIQTLGEIDRKSMLSTGGLPFAAKIIDQPYLSKYKTFPNTTKAIAVPAFVMGISGAILILIIALYRGESRDR